MLKQLLDDFAAPGSSFRGVPFWSLNGKLEESLMREEIRRFRDMGFGGFFFHSRSGMATPYLSKEWFRLVNVAAGEAKKCNLSMWIYDEDRWPSGAAGGIVTRDARYKVRYLVCDSTDASGGAPHVARFAGIFDGEVLTAYRPLTAAEVPAKNETLLTFSLRHGDADPWFNGECYLDALNPLAVKEFVKTTHEAYQAHCGQYFNSVIRGFFSDEPNFNSFPSGRTLPWTDDFAESFQAAYHYDITAHLPELVFPLREKFSKVRLDFRNHLTTRFDEAFGKTIGDWCQVHNLTYTGHLLGEDALSRAARNVGSPMRFYSFMEIPGVDLLTEHALIFNTVKQCVSVARQTGKKWRLSECYGCTGWDFSFAGYRALGEWQYALGINFRCLHHAHYTLRGQGKRDYPASIFYQSPWASEFCAVEEYFARLGAALTPGEEVRQLLVIHPIESAFFRVVGTAEVPETDALVGLTNLLLSHQLDFDFGDEEILSQKASLKNEKLRVGCADYRVVVIPEMATIRATTLDLLCRFAENGGNVFYLGDAPNYLDGVLSHLPRECYRRFTLFDLHSLSDALSLRFSVTENGKSVENCLALHKQGESFETLYLVNTGCPFTLQQMEAPRVADRKIAHFDSEVAWRLPKNFTLYRLDAETGKIYRHPFDRTGSGIRFSAPLGALESALFLATGENISDALPEKNIERDGFAPLPPKRIAVTLEEENLLVLDQLQCTADGKPVDGKTYMQLDAKLRLLCEAPARSAEFQPWCQIKHMPKRTLQLEMRYEITCEIIPQGEIFLALENPEIYEIFLNGTQVKIDQRGFWCDRAIEKIALPARLHRGKNELLLKRLYDETTPGLESLFLLGEFGVDAQDRLTAPVTHLEYGDWTKQGLPYYAGNIVYHLELPQGKKSVRFPLIGGAALENVDGHQVLMLPPFQMETGGKTTLDVRVLGSRRNALGPFYCDDHHHPMRRGAPAQFAAVEREQKTLVPSGILLPVEVSG